MRMRCSVSFRPCDAVADDRVAIYVRQGSIRSTIGKSVRRTAQATRERVAGCARRSPSTRCSTRRRYTRAPAEDRLAVAEEYAGSLPYARGLGPSHNVPKKGLTTSGTISPTCGSSARRGLAHALECSRFEDGALNCAAVCQITPALPLMTRDTVSLKHRRACDILHVTGQEALLIATFGCYLS